MELSRTTSPSASRLQETGSMRSKVMAYTAAYRLSATLSNEKLTVVFGVTYSLEPIDLVASVHFSTFNTRIYLFGLNKLY